MTLQEFFAENPKVALAFSGGVDSSYLLYAATNCRAKVRAYYVKSVFQPRFELDDARRLASELGADMKMLDVDILNDPQITANSADRCYYCKYSIFNSIIRAASEDGFSVLIDGTNASDDAGDRPDARAGGAFGSLPSAGMWVNKGGGAATLQKGGAFHLGQVGLCLPRHPNPYRRGDYAGNAAKD